MNKDRRRKSRNLLEKQGAPGKAPGKAHDKEVWLKVQAEYVIGKKLIKDIAKKYGVSESSIYRKKKQYRWVRNGTIKTVITREADNIIRDSTSDCKNLEDLSSSNIKTAVMVEVRSRAETALYFHRTFGRICTLAEKSIDALIKQGGMQTKEDMMLLKVSCDAMVAAKREMIGSEPLIPSDQIDGAGKEILAIPLPPQGEYCDYGDFTGTG